MWLLISQYFTFLSLSHLIFLSVNCQSAVYLTCQSARCEVFILEEAVKICERGLIEVVESMKLTSAC